MIDEIIRKFKAVTDVSSMRIGSFNTVGKHLITVYEVKKYGQLCAIRTKNDEAIIFNPLYRDMPMIVGISSGKEIQIRLIDTHTTEAKVDLSPLSDVAKRNTSVSDLKMKEAWSDDLVLPESIFKKGKPDDLYKLLVQWFGAYVLLMRDAPEAEELSKRRMAGIYSDGALEQGGVIMDIFKKDFKDPTERMNFFNQILFATEELAA